MEFRRVLGQHFRVPSSEVALAERELREHTIIPKLGATLDLKIRDDDDARVLASAVLPSLTPWSRATRICSTWRQSFI